ncbi:MAG: hypothetical protein ACP5I8_16730, partial [Phycisphaerae bacterium]
YRFSPCACDGNRFSYSFYQWKTGFIGRTQKWIFHPRLTPGGSTLYAPPAKCARQIAGCIFALPPQESLGVVVWIPKHRPANSRQLAGGGIPGCSTNLEVISFGFQTRSRRVACGKPRRANAYV